MGQNIRMSWTRREDGLGKAYQRIFRAEIEDVGREINIDIKHGSNVLVLDGKA